MPRDDYPESWEADEARLWEDIAQGRESDYGDMRIDEHAQVLFEAGWLEESHALSPDQRNAIRDEFFDYCIDEGFFYDRDDFDWEAWREYMGY